MCGDLKVIVVLFDLQLGYTKFYCFLFEWDSRARGKSSLKETMATSTSIDSKAKQNVISRPPTNPEKKFLPSVDLMKNFVKVMDRNGSGFLYRNSRGSAKSE
jgi:hypothetical protein